MRKKRLLARLSTFAGILLLSGALVLVLWNLREGRRAEQKSSEITDALTAAMPAPYSALVPSHRQMSPDLSSVSENSSEKLSTKTDPFSEANAGTFAVNGLTAETPFLSVGDVSYLGILYIPSANLELPVAADWSYEQLQSSPCRFFGNYQGDNMVLCGHNYASHFWALLNISMGAEVLFAAADGATYRYLVANREILAPDEVSRLLGKSTPAEWALTLVTCTPGGQSRCAVRCVRI